nr:MAG TPA: hypothetical protein [Caudoviricetes sp.]
MSHIWDDSLFSQQFLKSYVSIIYRRTCTTNKCS